MRGFYIITLFLAVASGIFVQPIGPVSKHAGYLPLQSSSDIQVGINEYPKASHLPEATERLIADRASTWLAARVYHTDDSIKEVTKYFETKGQAANKPAEPNALLKSLQKDNWTIRKVPVSSVSNVLGVGSELGAAGSAKMVETGFGVIVLDDSFVRVHLMSPHPASENNNKLASGTMIMMIRERLPQPEQDVANAGGVAEQEKVYKSREVTRRARVLSKPEPEGRSGVYGKVVLIAVLHSSGRVTNIRVVSELPGLTEAAIEAARKIKFDPAIKDGRFVSQWVQLEYHFH